MPVELKKPTFVDQIETLPPLAAVVERMLAVTASPHSSANDVAKVLCEDQTVAAKVLRVANSSFYGAPQNVTQVSRAVVMLGSVAVRNLVIGICARDALSSSGPQEAEHDELWRHSIAVAAACDLIAQQIGYQPSEEAFLAGLLHDIGQLAMVALEPKAFRAVFQAQNQGIPFLALERSHLELDHTEAGSQLLQRWGLPDALCYVIRHHHDRELREEDHHARLLAIVMLGDIFAHLIGVGLDVPAGHSGRIPTSVHFLKMTDSDQLRILDGLQHRIQQTTEMFAATDSTIVQPAHESSKRATWISDNTFKHYSIGQLLLEHHGYEVQRVSPNDLTGALLPDDLIMIDLPEEGNAASTLARSLVERDFRKVVVLANPTKGAALRQCDSENGMCKIPRLFTALDINWVEEQLKE